MRSENAAPPDRGELAANAVCRSGAEFAGFNFLSLAGAAFIATLVQAGCVHSSAPPVWDYYDQCAAANPSFLAMAECGRQKRLAECVPTNSCSPEGTAFMEYVDSLAVSVKSKKLNEAEALRRYAEYKSGGASTCARLGAEVKC